MALRVDPVDSFTSRAARKAREDMLERYALARAEILERANYLKQVAQGIKIMENQQARNREFFAQLSRRI